MAEIETLEELIATALAAEQNAARAYRVLAQEMRQHDNEELAQLFVRLAAEEEKHEKEIVQLASQFGAPAEPAQELPAWKDPAARLVDHDDATSPATSTAYKALAYAVDNEELAFRYFSYVAATAPNDRVRRIAEVFALEELAHAALLRAQRRRAFHEARKQVSTDQLPDPKQIKNLPELTEAALRIESGLLGRIASIDPQDEDLQALARRLRDGVEALRREREGTSTYPGNRAPVSGKSADTPRTAAAAGRTSQGALIELDRAFAFYDGVVQFTHDETVGKKAQELAALTLEHMKALQKPSTDGEL